MPKDFYRMRTIESLLGGHKELEEQSIYFAHPDQLNDPSERDRNVYWQGDSVVWANFFRNYLICLHAVFFDVMKNQKALTLSDLRICQTTDYAETAKQPVHAAFCRDLFQKAGIDALVDQLGSVTRPIFRAELLAYLQLLHATSIVELLVLYLGDTSGMKDVQTAFDPPFQGMHTVIRAADSPDAQAMLGELASTMGAMIEGILLSFKSGAPESAKGQEVNQSIETLLCDFPKHYMRTLEEDLFPQWYTACFMKDYTSAVSWAHYAGGHTGACLIFQARRSHSLWTIALDQSENGKSERPEVLPFTDVSYRDDQTPIDFFRSLGRMTRQALLKNWYEDSDGVRSQCATHVGTDEERVWRMKWVLSFIRDALVKGTDWAYEKESRLVLYDYWGEIQRKEQRVRRYDFASLRGLIFGVRTRDEDKLRIVDVIREKCRAHTRKKFDYYQATTDSSTGKIGIAPIVPDMLS